MNYTAIISASFLGLAGPVFAVTPDVGQDNLQHPGMGLLEAAAPCVTSGFSGISSFDPCAPDTTTLTDADAANLRFTQRCNDGAVEDRHLGDCQALGVGISQ